MTAPGSRPEDEPESLKRRFTADAEAEGRRLDQWLAEQIGELSRHQIQLHIKEERVRVNGAVEPARCRLRTGDRVEIEVKPGEPEGPLRPAAIALDIAFEDSDLLVVRKPPGLVVLPAPGHRERTLANALLAYLGRRIVDIGGEGRCGVVHRLDKLTSGLLIAAKNEAAFQALTEAVARREVDRRYLGLAMGTFKEIEGRINRPIGRRHGDRKRMGIVRTGEGREAQTSFRVLLQQDQDRISLLRIRLHTGRTHQIRVHLQSIGHPILGDPEYGWTKKQTLSHVAPELRSQLGPHWPERQMLHAAGLRFVHPRTEDLVTLVAPPPDDMQRLIELIFPGQAFDWRAVVFEEDESDRERESEEGLS